jgi:chromosome segregation ATPase
MTRTKRTTPAPEPQAPSTALALPDTPILIAAYSDPGQMEAVLKRIETDALAVAPDLSTATSRKEIASLAFKVARSKTALDDIGKEITEEARRTVDMVNAVRRDVRDRLDALKAKVRAPLDIWEAAEAARVADLEDRLRDFTDDLPDSGQPSQNIAAVLREIEDIPVDTSWQEFEARANEAKANAVRVLTERMAVAQAREEQEAELARLRAEVEARERAEQQRLAAERAKAEAERIERAKAEAAERAAQAERERAERAMREAEARAAREKAEAEERHRRELAEAAERERRAVEAERQRAAAEQARAEAERRAREADQARRAQVASDILNALRDMDFSDDAAAVIASLLMDGKIPHVKVEM